MLLTGMDFLNHISDMDGRNAADMARRNYQVKAVRKNKTGVLVSGGKY